MHFAAVTPPYLSHVRATSGLADALQRRGHRVTFVNQPDVAAFVPPAFGFEAVGAASHPPGALKGKAAEAARATTPWGILRLVSDMAGWTEMLCRDLPRALERIGAEAVLADEMEAAGGCVGEALGLPVVSVANAVPVRRDPAIPLPVLEWSYATTEAGRQRNRAAARVYDLLMTAHGRALDRQARRLGIPPRTRLDQCLSPLLGVSQLASAVDFPRPDRAPHEHGVGPFRAPEDDTRPLDVDIDPARPLVFASLGTFHGWRIDLFRRIAEACRALGAGLLVAHCGHLTAAQADSIGADWVTDFAPQRAVLARAALLVTHGGVNTVLDALDAGVPMLAIPLSFDQPGMAARIAYHGAGIALPPRRASTVAIRAALERLGTDGSFRENARRLGAAQAQAGGAERAADLIEAALRSA